MDLLLQSLSELNS